MKAIYRGVLWRSFQNIKCPKCGHYIYFDGTDYVCANVFSDGKYRDDEVVFFQSEKGCKNPLCEWSAAK